jgi:hypothetical protein
VNREPQNAFLREQVLFNFNFFNDVFRRDNELNQCLNIVLKKTTDQVSPIRMEPWKPSPKTTEIVSIPNTNFPEYIKYIFSYYENQ